MERTRKIMRRSIHIFLQNYQFFTTTSALLAFPFSATFFLSQALIPSSSILSTIHHSLISLFNAAKFPPSSQLFIILNLKLSQTISSQIFLLPLSFSFLILSKASIIQALRHQKKPSFFSFKSLFPPIFQTHLWNSLLIISANATCFSLLFITFNFLESLGYSSPTSLLVVSTTGAILYSVFLANTLIICNLALVSSGFEEFGGFFAILKACFLIRGRTETAILLALPMNMAMAGIEALFHYRVMRAYHNAAKLDSLMVLEGMFIAYLYSILVVLDTVVSCVFFRSCKVASMVDQEFGCYYRIGIEEESGSDFVNVKTLEDLP